VTKHTTKSAIPEGDASRGPRRLRLLALLLVAVAMFAVGCGGGGDDAADSSADSGNKNDPIVIGEVLSYSGTQAAFDLPAWNGQQLAAEKINAEGGVLGRKLKLVKFDQQSKPDLGQTGALEMIDQGASALVCAADFDIGAPCAVAAAGKKVPAISQGAADPKFGAKGIGPYAYTMGETTNAIGAALAEYSFNEKNWKNAYVIEGTTFEYTKGTARYFTKRFEELGGKIVGHDTMANDDTTIAAQVTRLKSAKVQPDAILLASTLPATPAAIKQIRAAGIDLPILGPDGFDGTYWIESVPDIDNVWFAAFGYLEGPDGGDAYKLAQEYKERFGKAPVNAFFLAGYATIEVIAAAIEQAGTTDPDKVNDALSALTDVETAVGPTTLAGEHYRTKPEMVISRFTNGKLELVEPSIVPESIPDPFE